MNKNIQTKDLQVSGLMLFLAKGYPSLLLSGLQMGGFCPSAKPHSLSILSSLFWSRIFCPLPAPLWSLEHT